jgi:hypothetical protein
MWILVRDFLVNLAAGAVGELSSPSGGMTSYLIALGFLAFGVVGWHRKRISVGKRGMDSWYFIALAVVVAIGAIGAAAYGIGLRSSLASAASVESQPARVPAANSSAAESNSQKQIAELQKELTVAQEANIRFAILGRREKLQLFLNDLPQNLKMIEGYASTVFQYKGQPVTITGFKPKQWAIDAERRWSDALKDLGQRYTQASGDTIDLTPTLPTTMELTYSATGEDAITDEGQRQRFRIFSIQKTKADALLNRIQSNSKLELEKVNRQISEIPIRSVFESLSEGKISAEKMTINGPLPQGFARAETGGQIILNGTSVNVVPDQLNIAFPPPDGTNTKLSNREIGERLQLAAKEFRDHSTRPEWTDTAVKSRELCSEALVRIKTIKIDGAGGQMILMVYIQDRAAANEAAKFLETLSDAVAKI